jgi:hypothetical protein
MRSLYIAAGNWQLAAGNPSEFVCWPLNSGWQLVACDWQTFKACLFSFSKAAGN